MALAVSGNTIASNRRGQHHLCVKRQRDGHAKRTSEANVGCTRSVKRRAAELRARRRDRCSEHVLGTETEVVPGKELCAKKRADADSCQRRAGGIVGRAG